MFCTICQISLGSGFWVFEKFRCVAGTYYSLHSLIFQKARNFSKNVVETTFLTLIWYMIYDMIWYDIWYYIILYYIILYYIILYYIILYYIILYMTWNYVIYDMIYDIFVNCSWVDTRWQQYNTHLHTNNTTQSTQTIHRTTQLIWEECRPCPVLASYTLAFALQLRKKHEKTSVRVVGECQLARWEQNIRNRAYITIRKHKHKNKNT